MNQNSLCPQGAFASLQQLVHKNLAAAISRCEFSYRCLFFLWVRVTCLGLFWSFCCLVSKRNGVVLNNFLFPNLDQVFSIEKDMVLKINFLEVLIVLGLCLSGHSGTSPKDRCGSDTSDGAASTTGAFAHHYRPGEMGISIDLVPPQDMQSLLFLEDVPRAHWNPQGERSRLCFEILP